MAEMPDFTEKADIVELSSASVLRQLVGNICFIVPDVTDLTDEETAIKTEILKRYNLYMFSSVDSGNIDFSNFSVILLSTGLTLADLDDLVHLEKPVITLDSSHPNGLLEMTTNAGTDSSSESQVDVQTIEQQIISGADITATGYTTVYSGGDTLTGVTLAGVSGIINLALKVGTAYSALCVLEKDADNASGDPNPDIRIFFGMLSGDKFNTTGLALLMQSILYAGCMASNVSYSSYQLLKKLQTIEYKVSSVSTFPLGNMYFVKTTGLDTNDGTSWAKARLTIDSTVGLCTGDNNDYIFVAPGAYDEDANVDGVKVDVAGVHIIGPQMITKQYFGSGFAYVENTNAAATMVFNVTGADVEITGLTVYETTNTVEGILLAGYNALIHLCAFTGAMENGIRSEGLGSNVIEDCYFYLNTNDGIEVKDDHNTIRNNEIHRVGDYGINIDDVDNYVYSNIINGGAGATDIGIRVVTPGARNTIVDNWIAECATSPTFDSGTNNTWINHVDKLSGSFNLLVADGVALTDKIANIDLPSGGRFVAQFDMDTFDTNEAGTQVSIYVYVKIDGTTYRIVDYRNFLAGTDTTHPRVEFDSEGGSNKAKVATQVDAAVTGTRAIPYKITQITP